MDSFKILRVGKKLVSFLEKNLGRGKVCDTRVYNKAQNYLDILDSRWDIEELEDLKEVYMNHLVRLYMSQYS